MLVVPWQQQQLIIDEDDASWSFVVQGTMVVNGFVLVPNEFMYVLYVILLSLSCSC
jgi:hypothetical protein